MVAIVISLTIFVACRVSNHFRGLYGDQDRDASMAKCKSCKLHTSCKLECECHERCHVLSHGKL